MTLTATDAKNRFGQVLEQAQRQPVTIEKAGRRHSVVMSAAHYDSLLAAIQNPITVEHGEASRRFYEQYKDWVDLQNGLVEANGIPGEEYRTW
jgi:prevent-host-death family protein